MQPAGHALRHLTSGVGRLDFAATDIGGFDVAVPTVGLWETLLHRWSEPNTELHTEDCSGRRGFQ
jgi:hypothetical protein